MKKLCVRVYRVKMLLFLCSFLMHCGLCTNSPPKFGVIGDGVVRTPAGTPVTQTPTEPARADSIERKIIIFFVDKDDTRARDELQKKLVLEPGDSLIIGWSVPYKNMHPSSLYRVKEQLLPINAVMLHLVTFFHQKGKSHWKAWITSLVLALGYLEPAVLLEIQSAAGSNESIGNLTSDAQLVLLTLSDACTWDRLHQEPLYRAINVAFSKPGAWRGLMRYYRIAVEVVYHYSLTPTVINLLFKNVQISLLREHVFAHYKPMGSALNAMFDESNANIWNRDEWEGITRVPCVMSLIQHTERLIELMYQINLLRMICDWTQVSDSDIFIVTAPTAPLDLLPSFLQCLGFAEHQVKRVIVADCPCATLNVQDSMIFVRGLRNVQESEAEENAISAEALSAAERDRDHDV